MNTPSAPPDVLPSTLPATDQRRQQVRAAETRLLYENGTTGVVASILIALPLAYSQRHVVSSSVVSTWFLFVLAVAVVRFVIARRYWSASSGEIDSRRWNNAFVVGTALASATWATAAMMFYQSGQATNGTFLMFVLGGVMLGGASLLAARPEAFVTFFLPIGLLTATRLALEGDEEHWMMAFLVIIFTAATIATTSSSMATMAAMPIFSSDQASDRVRGMGSPMRETLSDMDRSKRAARRRCLQMRWCRRAA